MSEPRASAVPGLPDRHRAPVPHEGDRVARRRPGQPRLVHRAAGVQRGRLRGGRGAGAGGQDRPGPHQGHSGRGDEGPQRWAVARHGQRVPPRCSSFAGTSRHCRDPARCATPRRTRPIDSVDTYVSHHLSLCRGRSAEGGGRTPTPGDPPARVRTRELAATEIADRVGEVLAVGDLPAPRRPEGRQPRRRPARRHPTPLPVKPRGDGPAPELPRGLLDGRARTATGGGRGRATQPTTRQERRPWLNWYGRSTAASPDVIFPFLVDPEQYARWGGSDVELDARPGGTFRALMGGTHRAEGEFVEVEPDTRVVFSFGWAEPDHPSHPAPPRSRSTWCLTEPVPRSGSPTAVCPRTPSPTTPVDGTTTWAACPPSSPVGTRVPIGWDETTRGTTAGAWSRIPAERVAMAGTGEALTPVPARRGSHRPALATIGPVRRPGRGDGDEVWLGGTPGTAGVPRRRVGRPRPRRHPALRAPDPRGCPGRVELAHGAAPDRAGYRAAFAGFEPAVVARFTPEDVDRLLEDPGIIRHRGKIESTVSNAAAVLALQESGGTLDGLLWSSVDGSTRTRSPHDTGSLPTTTPEARELSRTLKRRGFRFVGPTTCYSLMQAAGMVDDHEPTCFRYGRPGTT